MDEHCPPIAALRVVTGFVDLTNDNVFKCYDFDCPAGQSSSATRHECATIDGDGFSVPIDSGTACKMSTLVGSFQAGAQALRDAISEMEAEATAMQPKIATQLKQLIDGNLINPFVNLISAKTMDCSFLADTFQGLLDGMCYGLGGAIAGYATIFKVLGFCGFLLVFLNFGLWYYFANHAAIEEKPKDEKDEKQLSATPNESA